MFSKQTPEIQLTQLADMGEVDYPKILGGFIGPEDTAGRQYGTYDVLKGRGLIGIHHAERTGTAKIHGILCSEIKTTYNHYSNGKTYENVQYCRLNDNKVQLLAIYETYPDGVKALYTFKDEYFMETLSVGHNNEGMAVRLKSSGTTCISGNTIKTACTQPGTYDLLGRYRLVIDQQVHEVYKFVFLAHEHQFSEFFINEAGEELMHRFYIPDNGFGGARIEQPYSSEFPHAEVLEVNGVRVIMSSIEISEKAFEPITETL